MAANHYVANMEYIPAPPVEITSMVSLRSWLECILQNDSFYYTYHYHENLNVSVRELSTKALHNWKPSSPPSPIGPSKTDWIDRS
jgi:hypothetical protein